MFSALKRFPHYRQLDMMDCGPTCLKMIAEYHGKDYPLPFLRKNCFIDRQGVSLMGISSAAEKIGMRTLAVKATYDLLFEKGHFPCIAHWRQNHFVVIYKMTEDKVWISDPAATRLEYTREEFCKFWISTKKGEGEEQGIVLFLEPKPEFYESEYEGKVEKANLSFLFRYLKPFQKGMTQLFIGAALSSVIALFTPFFTQSIVDFGIHNQDLDFVYLILVSQLLLFVAKMSLEMIRRWLMLHIATRVNLSIISDFLYKLMKMPISFFDSKNVGDISQRLRDHERIKTLLTSSSVDIAFSFFYFVVFGGILASYNITIFGIYFIGSAFFVAWVTIFLNKRRILDFKRFNELSADQSNDVQLITGMQEIKLHNCERQKRWNWEGFKARLFEIDLESLTLFQYQRAGGSFINELKNILINFICAKQVISGDMTLGMMMATTYIMGQLDAPLLRLIDFIKELQDASITVERLNEIHNAKDEEEIDSNTLNSIELNQDIIIKNLSFRYGNPHANYVLHNLNITIPYGKTTAIVGSSGSGKTTLLKLLLKFYEPESGEILLGNVSLLNINTHLWRESCGSVLQDGFIFSDTIANNIAVSDEDIDKKRLVFAADVANIREYVEGLPLRYNTKIGSEGVGLSQGQKQRILIARAIYKNPDFIFFDEATSALDANNEKEITEKINSFTKGKTSIVIAHRLSTVKNADQIIVLHKGQVVEVGNHQELIVKKGMYFNLVKNQLELGD